MGRSRITGAGRQTLRRTCSTISTTRCCASLDAPVAFASTPDGNTASAPDAAAVRARVDALIDVVVGIYAPLPRPSLSMVVSRLRYAAPQCRGESGRPHTRTRTPLSGPRRRHRLVMAGR